MTLPDALLPQWSSTFMFYCANVFGVLGMLILMVGSSLTMFRDKDTLDFFFFALGQTFLSAAFFLVYTPSYAILTLLLACVSLWVFNQRHAGNRTPSLRVTKGVWLLLPGVLASVHAVGVGLLVMGDVHQAAWAATAAMLFAYLGFAWAKLNRKAYLISMLMSNAIGAMHLYEVGHYGVFAMTSITSGIYFTYLTRSTTSTTIDQA
ncbi:hypothetical protein AB6D11_18565 [Vibrio splendidus]